MLNLSSKVLCFALASAVSVALLGGCADTQRTVGQKMASARQRIVDLPKSSRKILSEDLSAALHSLDAKGATLAARVIDLQTGEELYAENIDTPMIPASNGKLTISAAGLDMFGPYHTFKTYLIVDGNDLWIVGSGDPATGDGRIARNYGGTETTIFDNWAEALRRRGITKIRGNLYYWDRAFDEQWTHPNWKSDFLVDWYAAPVSGLSFNDNCIDVTAYPDGEGAPARLEVVPPNTLAQTDNQNVSAAIETGGDDESAKNKGVEITREQDAPRFTVKGTIRQKASYESKPITDPGAFFANAFRTHLENNGIEVAGETRRAESLPFGATGPSIDRVVAVHETSIVDVLSRINKQSQNLFAEAMSKSIGREYALRRYNQSVPGSWELGETAAREFLERNGIDATEFRAVDGSGLARENRVTARHLTDLLLVMWRHPHGHIWRNSLAIGGVDGTIAKRQKDFPGQILAKTGYIGGVRTLSGYAHTNGGRWLAFSFLFNDIEGDVKPFEGVQDDGCWVLIHYPNRTPPRAKEPPTAPPPAKTVSEEPATQPSEESPPPMAPATNPSN